MAHESELARVQQFLRTTFGNPGIALGGSGESAEMHVDGAQVATVFRVVDEGETSYDLQMVIREPLARSAADRAAGNMTDEELTGLEDRLCRTLGHDGISLAVDTTSPHSAEVNVNGEFMGVVSKIVDQGDTAYELHISILDIDLA